MEPIFVTGTDTNVGKTVICGLLARFLKEKEINVVIQKWIETGEGDSDIEQHRILSGREHFQYIRHILPYKFKKAASPHLASYLEKRKISKDKIKKSFLFLRAKFDLVIVEGIGGALVPFNRKELVIDIAKELELSSLIVAKNKLGAINHTLLTIEAINKRGIPILGLVFNQEDGEDGLVLEDNPKIIKRFSGLKVFGSLPYSKDKSILYEKFTPIGGKIWSLLRKT